MIRQGAPGRSGADFAALPGALRPSGVRSEALESPVAGVGDLEERVELRQLEQRLEIVVRVREPQLAALLSNLLRQRHEHTEARAVDVPGLRKVDQEFFLAPLELIEHL